jgi:heparosan-N-sulfate-glucuronate 5-epimerase
MLGSFWKQWRHRLGHWYGMFAGTSYYHLPQGLGRAFVPNELKGYFNDLTGKTNWMGKLDEHGLPYNTLSTGAVVYFPTVLCQKALGHWDLWQMHAAQEDRKGFLNVAEWLAAKQDSNGGWDTWGLLGKSAEFRYSSMTQGEGISVLVRAHSLTRAPEFEAACLKAIGLMQKPVQDGGVCCYESSEVFLEEYPGPWRDTVLNGWLFSLFGVHDFLLGFPDGDVKTFYNRTCGSLIRSLPEFDAGYWSYYSSRTKRMASPFYHHLHLSQLQALNQVTSEPSLRLTLDAWTRYGQSKPKKLRALVVKGFQKIREPHEIAIVD